MSCVAGCLFTVFHLRCSQVQGGSSTCSTSKAKRSRAHEEAGQRRRVRGVPRRSEPHSPSAAQPQKWLGESRSEVGPCQDEQGLLLATHAAKTGEPHPLPPPRDKGAPTQGTVGADPRTGRAPTQELAFKYLRGTFVHRAAARTDNHISKKPLRTNHHGVGQVETSVFSTSSIFRQPSCWARELCFGDQVFFRLTPLTEDSTQGRFTETDISTTALQKTDFVKKRSRSMNA